MLKWNSARHQIIRFPNLAPSCHICKLSKTYDIFPLFSKIWSVLMADLLLHNFLHHRFVICSQNGLTAHVVQYKKNSNRGAIIDHHSGQFCTVKEISCYHTFKGVIFPFLPPLSIPRRNGGYFSPPHASFYGLLLLFHYFLPSLWCISTESGN
jgi:hypothetical protein